MNAFQKKVAADYDYSSSFLSNATYAVTKIGTSQGYFQQNNYKRLFRQAKEWAGLYIVLGLLVMVIGNLISYSAGYDLAFGAYFIFALGCFVNAAYFRKQGQKLILFTQFGADEYAKWRGLFNFLDSETLMKEKTFVEVAIWEKYLIYATAFGIADKVIKALKIRCPEAYTSPVLRNPYVCSSAFIAGSHSFGTATRTASYASGAGGHGGYGGGGRGGGGGGGGH
jgi:uncharacterized membrane protein